MILNCHGKVKKFTLLDAEVRFVTSELIANETSVSVCVESGVTGGFETALTVGLAAQDGTASELI